MSEHTLLKNLESNISGNVRYTVVSAKRNAWTE